MPTLIITGTCGVGKSTIAAEINDAPAEAKVPNAATDLDALTWQGPSSGSFLCRLVAPESLRVDRLRARMPPVPHGIGMSVAVSS